MKKKKIVLFQLPVPVFVPNKVQNRNFYTNTLLAPGYLKSAAFQKGLMNFYDIEILPQDIADYGGDGFITEYIKKQNPDYVGVSLYCWNITRALSITSKLKEVFPHLKVIAGGPEVPINRISPLINENVDIAVRGPAEETFTELLNSLITGAPLENVNGITFAENMTGLPKFEKLDVKSPFLRGFIDFNKNSTFTFTSRGCKYNCSYCLWGNFINNPIRRDINDIKDELIFAKKQGVKYLRLTDSNINNDFEWLKKITNTINKVNSDSLMDFEVFLRLDTVNNETIKHLKKANIKYLITGLQSTNFKSCLNVGRKYSLKKWISNAKRLLKDDFGFDININIMLGLPGDTIEDIKETFGILIENNFNVNVYNFPLTVSPSSNLWEQRRELGLTIQEDAPYLVLETPSLSFSELKQAIQTAGALSNPPNSVALEPFCKRKYPLLTVFSSGSFPSNYKEYCEYTDFMPQRADKPISKIIFENYENLEREVPQLANLISYSTILWFKGGWACEMAKIKSLLKEISEKNPFNVWHIILEAEKPFEINYLVEINDAIFYKPNYLDYQAVYLANDYKNTFNRVSTRIYTLLNIKNSYSTQWIDEICGKSRLMWHVDISPFDTELKSIIKKSMNMPSLGVYINFSSNSNRDYILKLLSIIKEYNIKGLPITFSNWIIQYLWNLNFSKEPSYWEGTEENILLLNKTIKYNTFSEEKLQKDIAAFRAGE